MYILDALQSRNKLYFASLHSTRNVTIWVLIRVNVDTFFSWSSFPGSDPLTEFCWDQLWKKEWRINREAERNRTCTSQPQTLESLKGFELSGTFHCMFCLYFELCRGPEMFFWITGLLECICRKIFCCKHSYPERVPNHGICPGPQGIQKNRADGETKWFCQFHITLWRRNSVLYWLICRKKKCFQTHPLLIFPLTFSCSYHVLGTV